ATAVPDHDAVAPAVETVLTFRPKSACIAGVGIVNEDSPIVAEDPMGVEEEAEGYGAIVGVAVLLHLPPAKHAVIRAQLLFAAVCLKQAMGTVGMAQGLERIGLGDQAWSVGRIRRPCRTDCQEQCQGQAAAHG